MKCIVINIITCYLCLLPDNLFSQDGGGKYKGKHQVLTSTATITINVLDAQDMPPSFIGTPYFGYVYEVSVPVRAPPTPNTSVRVIIHYMC